MGSRLQQALRSLCFNTGWKYAILWKLKHRARMMFTWEDVYYDGSHYGDNKWSNATIGSLSEGPCSHDPLGLAVAKMSYQVYSLGEGVVGHVAVSGKHLWIFSDQHYTDLSTTFEYYDGWQTQFSAGIKTIAVVSVIPHGVVQLGSLNKIAEDLKFVDHIRNIFSELQDSLAGCIPSSLKSNTENTCLSDMCTIVSDSSGHHCLEQLKGSVNEDEVNLWSQLLSFPGESVDHSRIFPLREGYPNKTLKMKMQEKAESSMPENDILLLSSCENSLTKQLRQEGMESHDRNVGKLNDIRDFGKRSEIQSTPTEDTEIEKSSLYNATQVIDCSQMVTFKAPSEILDSTPFLFHGDISVPKLSTMQLHQDFEDLELPVGSSRVEMRISPFSFCSGYELYEALGPFHKQNECVWEVEKTASDMAVDISEGMGSCSMLMDNSDVHLLDAVVAKASYKGDRLESEISCRDTGESLLTAERTPCTSIVAISSAGFSFDQDTSSSLNSVTCGVESLKGISSTSSSRGSEHMDRLRGPVKVNKKRARPGESSRPRPRDRQLIQDRIKELRELIPNGSKCSIDSLLERTVKHMIFLQNVTRHAEKLRKCSASKLLDKETGMQKFSRCEQGSSWAVEVGNNRKVCPIIVENINMNGQMLVEMLCKECGQFLDVAETIRSLGLSILKGVSEAYGNNTWMCFVVEGQHNRNMHRMDVLWSLMQLLQPNN